MLNTGDLGILLYCSLNNFYSAHEPTGVGLAPQATRLVCSNAGNQRQREKLRLKTSLQVPMCLCRDQLHKMISQRRNSQSRAKEEDRASIQWLSQYEKVFVFLFRKQKWNKKKKV